MENEFDKKVIAAYDEFEKGIIRECTEEVRGVFEIFEEYKRQIALYNEVVEIYNELMQEESIGDELSAELEKRYLKFKEEYDEDEQAEILGAIERLSTLFTMPAIHNATQKELAETEDKINVKFNHKIRDDIAGIIEKRRILEVLVLWIGGLRKTQQLLREQK